MGSTYPLENTGCLEKTPYASPGFGLEHPGFQIHNLNLLIAKPPGQIRWPHRRWPHGQQHVALHEQRPRYHPPLWNLEDSPPKKMTKRQVINLLSWYIEVWGKYKFIENCCWLWGCLGCFFLGSCGMFDFWRLGFLGLGPRWFVFGWRHLLLCNVGWFGVISGPATRLVGVATRMSMVHSK